ncbi:VPLPA-CTERM protein sorting domain-containing protein [Cognatiyoonia koreensis]|uniref:VPLPA-CTERM protein sorting domain-containing protein n=1 Tax=Cognatiyoonia koreensis TaxID=364200 RepID=A0A1I0RSK2_9RHOB|nr:VPLPA-CTERM sorting domain-containing protein [Cognatiyoonia koreensis]SEW44270.1 VPLPA-CTERM protein sorting domain-containing protein [Cognatiyoonia koreensis]
MKTYLTAAAVALATLGTAASAATLTADTTLGLAPGSPAGQDFVTELQGAGATDLFSGNLSIILNQERRVTFTLVGAESSFDNTLVFNGSDIIAESIGSGGAGQAVANMTTDLLDGGLGLNSFTTVLGSGVDIASLLTFRVGDAASSVFSAVDHEFGVFADAASLSNLSVFFLALDDDGNNKDDNHDDIIVRVDISAVPIPASGLLLLAGMGGLAAMRRRRKS